MATVPVVNSLAWYKSPVAVGLLVSVLLKLLAIFAPNWAAAMAGSEEEVTQQILLLASFLGDFVAFLGRLLSKVQPLTLTDQSKSLNSQVKHLQLIIVVPLLGVMLGGCYQRPMISPAVVGPVAPADTRVDRAIARVAPEVAKYCSLMRGALVAGQFMASDPSHVRVVQTAALAVNAYCAAPPTNVQQALAALSQLWVQVAAARSEAVEMWLRETPKARR